MVIFRENTEDVYAGIEWPQGSPEAKKVIDFLTKEMQAKIRPDSGIGIKPISVTGSKQLVRMAIQYALARKRKNVTLVHKGNIMKYTEGAFRDWGYELAREEFGKVTVTHFRFTRSATIGAGIDVSGELVITDLWQKSGAQWQLLRRFVSRAALPPGSE